MIPLLTREAVRAVDHDAVDRFLVPSLLLMENAGAGATQVLLSACGARAARALVIGGVGQNGGDAWVVARQLLVRGMKPRCFLVGDPDKVKGDARVNLQALTALGVAVTACDETQLPTLRAAAAEAEVIVDGLFGTGLDRELTGLYAGVVEIVNQSEAPAFALDLPSGIDANTGQIWGAAVRAHWTATFAAHKRGLHQFPGVEHAGEVTCVSIGVPLDPTSPCGLIEAKDVTAVLPARPLDAHKGDNGRILILAGSAGKTGAAMLSALGAMRSGAGLVTIATDALTRRALDQKIVEVMTAELPEQDALAAALDLCAGQHAAVVGPGLGLSPDKRAFAQGLAKDLPVPCVLDADALTAIGRGVNALREAAGPRVLTPHPGEASRLLGRSVAEVESDRYASALRLAQESGQVVVLKGARTVVASPSGSVRVCRSGTPALGSGGTGDVLSGVIAALCVQLDPFEAAWAGVELHARAGSLAARGDRGLLASEVAAHVPLALSQCRAEVQA